MSNHVIKLAAVSGKTITQTIELQPGVAGAPASLDAVANGKFVLIDESTGLAPRQVAVKRVGQDLYIGLEGASADQPQVIIENYYGSGSQLVGEAEGGSTTNMRCRRTRIRARPCRRFPRMRAHRSS